MQQPQQPGKILRWERLRQLITEKVRVTTASAEHHRYWAGVKEGLEWLLIEMMGMPAEDLSAPASPVKSQLFLGDKLPAHLRKDMDKHSARWKALGWPPMSWEEGAEWMYWRAVMNVNKEPDLLEVDEPASPVEELAKVKEELLLCVRERNKYLYQLDTLTESKPSPVIEIGEQLKPEDLPQTENPLASYWFEKARLCLVDRNDFKAQLARANEKIVELAKASHHNKNQENA